MKEAKNIAVVGATGLVGKTFLQLLESDHFLDSDIHLLACKKSEGKEVTFRNSNFGYITNRTTIFAWCRCSS